MNANGNCGYLGLLRILQILEKVSESTTMLELRVDLHKYARDHSHEFVGCPKNRAVYQYEEYNDDEDRNKEKFQAIVKSIYKNGRTYTSCKKREDHFNLNVIPIAMRKYQLSQFAVYISMGCRNEKKTFMRSLYTSDGKTIKRENKKGCKHEVENSQMLVESNNHFNVFVTD